MKTRSVIKNRGLGSLVLVIFVAALASFVLILAQSRIVSIALSGRSSTDTMLSSYYAESVVNDLMARLIDGTYNISLSGDQTVLPDGTIVTVTPHDPDDGTYVVTVTLPYAESTLEVSAVTTTTTQAAYDKVEIMFAVDCSWSMSSAADSANRALYGSRMHQAHEALKGFLAKIETLPTQEEKDKYFIGLSVFRDNGIFVKDSVGNITPTNDRARLNNAIDAYLESTLRPVNDNSNNIVPRCYDGFGTSKLTGNTSVGSGFGLVNDYFEPNLTVPRLKRVSIMLTDGESVSKTPNALCPAHYPPGLPANFYCPGLKEFCTDSVALSLGYQCNAALMNTCNFDGDPNDCSNVCKPYANDFVNCTMASTNQTYQSVVAGDQQTYHGTRNPLINAYAVTMNVGSNTSMQTILGTGHYFMLNNASALSNTLTNNIFEEIRRTTTNIDIHPGQ